MIGMDKGDFVVCVDASCDPWGRPVVLVQGQVYQIETVHSDLPHGTLGAIWTDTVFDLVGVPCPVQDGDEYSYGAYRFRPIDRGPPVEIERKELVEA